jgi:hypothetical protein
MQITIELRGFEKATGAIRAAVIEGMRNGLEAAALRGQELVGGLIEKPYEQHGARMAHGLLLDSIISEIRPEAGLVGSAVIFAQPPSDVYSGVIEFGRRPGRFPPPDAIRLWLQAPKMQAAIRGGGPVDPRVSALAKALAARRRGKKRVKRNLTAQERAERTRAFLIGLKIAAVGFPGHFMFKRTGDALKPELQEIFNRQIAAAIEARGLKK